MHPIVAVEETQAVVVPDNVPCAVKGLPFSSYLLDGGVSQTTLKTIGQKCPMVARYNQLNPSEESETFILGSAIHCALLEPERFAVDYAVGPNVKLSTKAGKAAWAEFDAANPGKIILRHHHGDIIDGILKRTKASAPLSRMRSQEGDHELSLFWDDNGTRCKARLDKLIKGPRYSIIDIKSTMSAAPDDWKNSFTRYWYHFQAAWYRMGVRAVMGNKPVDVFFICFEKTPPYPTAIYTVKEKSLDVGESQARELLKVYNRCVADNHFPDYSERIVEIGLSKWFDPTCDFIRVN